MIKKLKNKKVRLSYKQMVCLCLMAVMLVFVCVFGAYSYYNYHRECELSAARAAANTADKVVAQVNEKLYSIRNYYVARVSEDSVKHVIDNPIDFANYTDNQEALDAFSGLSYLDNCVSKYTFINYKTGWILNNKGMFPISEAQNAEVLDDYFYDREEKREQYYWAYDTTPPITNKIQKEYRTIIETDGLNFVLRLPYGYQSHAMLLVNVNMDSWRTWTENHLGEGEYVLVADSDGAVIYSNNEHLKLLYEQEGELLLEQVVKVNGRKYLGACAPSNVLGWNYYVFHDLDMEYSGFRMPLLWVVFMILVAVIMFVLAAYMIYRPISALMKDVAPESSERKGVKNELDYLAGSFKSLQWDKQALQERIDFSKDRLLEMFELRLIKGEVHREDEWQEYIQDFQLRSWKYFATVVLVLDLSEEEIQSNVKEDVICLTLVQEMPDSIKEYAWMPPIYNSCTICAIFAENDEDVLLKKIREYYAGMQEYAENVTGYRLLCGVSSNHIDRKHIQAAYRESIKALTYPMVSREEWAEPEKKEMANLNFYLASTTVHASGDYDIRLEKEVQTGVKALDKNQCYQATDEFFTGLKDGGVNLHENMIFTIRFANAILLTATEAKVNLEELYPQGIRKLYSELLDAFEPARARRYIKMHLIDPILEVRGELLNQKSYSMLEDIEKMIAEKKGDITLSECAEALQVHPTYIWKILKMDKGRSFSDYLEEYKLEEAKRLLLNTSMSVAEIASELNYTNAQNFIRFFSKSMGITPGKFRKLNE